MGNLGTGFGNQGGGGGGVAPEVIEVTQAEFISLVSSDGLTFPATYKITDIENGLFVNALSANTFSENATVFILQPNYVINGDYKGQLLPTDTVSIGEIWVYGNHFWESTTGVNSTPIDFLNLDGTDWTQIAKSEANNYVSINFICEIAILNNDIYITKLKCPETQDEISSSALLISGGVILIKSWIVGLKNANASSNSNIGSVVNNRIVDTLFAANVVVNNFSNQPFIYNVDGIDGELAGNISYTASTIHDGIIRSPDSTVARNFMTNSEITNFDLDGNGCVRISELNNSKIDGITITSGSGKIGVGDLYMYECDFTNITDINIQQSNFHDIDIDFSGFTVDVYGENIINGNGWFTITHDFSTSPLNSGSSVLYNLIPAGARMTNCTIIPDTLSGGAGATLRIGMESDDVSYGLAATAIGSIVNTVVSTISNPATANRSLQLTAGTNDITGGTVTVKVEFMV